jgi:hypothetical protein
MRKRKQNINEHENFHGDGKEHKHAYIQYINIFIYRYMYMFRKIDAEGDIGTETDMDTGIRTDMGMDGHEDKKNCSHIICVLRVFSLLKQMKRLLTSTFFGVKMNR